jgi:PAS domain S-box-containing protein
MRKPTLPRMERLTARLALGIALLVMVPLAVGLYLLSRHEYGHTISARQTAAELENRILEAALRHQMLRVDTRLMTEILREVGRQPEVRRAMVLDHDGVVRLSSREADLGLRLTPDSPTCMVCHAQQPEARPRSVLLREQDGQVLRSVLPIANRSECHRCHDSSKRLNGILILDVSLVPIQTQFRADMGQVGLATGVLTIVLIAGVGVFTRYLVLRRLTRLSRTARSIADGALSERAEVSGGDVVATLAADFNSMADSTAALIDEVRARERQLSGVLNSLDDGLLVLDREFRVVAANRSLARRLATYPETLRGRSCREAIRHALPCRDDEMCPAARCLSTGALQRAVYQLPSPTDGARVHEVYASPVFSDDGSMSQIVEVWRDITERVREEERLAEIERLSSLGVLASGLSHEVNTPLATTLMCSEIILDRISDCEAGGAGAETLESIRDSAATIRDQVFRCRTITDQFRRFARGIPPDVELIDLPAVVAGVVALVKPTATAAGVRLGVEPPGPVPRVTANTEVVQHVVLNVLVNAIESFAQAGGMIAMRFIVDGGVRLQIRDTGCGIPLEIQRQLFEPFRSKKPGGTGLGLFLSRTFMRRFSGDVRLVDSVVGRGSCVEIVFTRAAEAA